MIKKWQVQSIKKTVWPKNTMTLSRVLFFPTVVLIEKNSLLLQDSFIHVVLFRNIFKCNKPGKRTPHIFHFF